MPTLANRSRLVHLARVVYKRTQLTLSWCCACRHHLENGIDHPVEVTRDLGIPEAKHGPPEFHQHLGFTFVTIPLLRRVM